MLPPILAAFRNRYPLVRLTLLNRPGEGIYRALADGRADLGIGYLLGGRTRVGGETIARLRFFLVAKKGRKGSGVDSAEKLLSEPLLLFEKGFDLRNYVEGRLGPLASSLELPSAGSLLRYAEGGFGPALVPFIGEPPPSRELEWTSLDDRVPPLPLELYLREGAAPSKAAYMLAQAIREGSVGETTRA